MADLRGNRGRALILYITRDIASAPLPSPTGSPSCTAAHIVETGPTLKRSSPTRHSRTPTASCPAVPDPAPSTSTRPPPGRPARRHRPPPAAAFRTRCPLAVDSLPPRHSHACSKVGTGHTSRQATAPRPPATTPPWNRQRLRSNNGLRSKALPPGPSSRVPADCPAHRLLGPRHRPWSRAGLVSRGRHSTPRAAAASPSSTRPDPRAGHTSSASTSGAPGCARAVADLSGTIVSAPEVRTTAAGPPPRSPDAAVACAEQALAEPG